MRVGLYTLRFQPVETARRLAGRLSGYVYARQGHHGFPEQQVLGDFAGSFEVFKQGHESAPVVVSVLGLGEVGEPFDFELVKLLLSLEQLLLVGPVTEVDRLLAPSLRTRVVYSVLLLEGEFPFCLPN